MKEYLTMNDYLYFKLTGQEIKITAAGYLIYAAPRSAPRSADAACAGDAAADAAAAANKKIDFNKMAKQAVKIITEGLINDTI